MTQITGKIYQQTNAAGTENRFPRTVMEAVLGLNSYLQNQFSALADIYMPIEGITESKPLQEFVYRLCPSTIKAKSLTLDRIYGKTLAWNQIAPNKQGVSSAEIYNPMFARGESQIVEGHKYYASCLVPAGCTVYRQQITGSFRTHMLQE